MPSGGDRLVGEWSELVGGPIHIIHVISALLEGCIITLIVIEL